MSTSSILKKSALTTVTGVVFLTLVTVEEALAVQPASWNISSGFGSTTFAEASELSIDITLSTGIPNGGEICFATPGDCSSIFEDLILTEDDVGKVFTSNATNNPDFNDVVSILTNGVNDPIVFSESFTTSYGAAGILASEAYAFLGDITGANGIDFQGQTITSFSLLVNSLTIVLEEENYASASVDLTLNVNSVPVPEPDAVMGLLAVGCLGASLVFKHKKKKGRFFNH